MKPLLRALVVLVALVVAALWVDHCLTEPEPQPPVELS